MTTHQSNSSNPNWFGCNIEAETRALAEKHLARPDVDIVVIPAEDHPGTPNPWRRLPPELAALVASPQSCAAVACRTSPPVSPDVLWETLLDQLERGRVLIDTGLTATPMAIGFPSLAPSSAPSLPRWRRQRIGDLPKRLTDQIQSPADAIALQAGLLQIADQLDASHELSQSIEGEGARHAGDYWHAINHRREPDYGNAKYWFRHVGHHPLLDELAPAAIALAEGHAGSLTAKVAEMTANGRLDPYRFVDFVENACRSKNQEAKSFAEALQWAEMIGLLAGTWRDVTATT